MKDCKVHSISELPFFLVETSATLQFLSKNASENFIQSEINIGSAVDENIAPSFEHESITKNNKRNILVGNLGEEIAQAYLSTTYPKVRRIAIEKSNEGYDIIAKGVLCFEVKTSTSKSYEFEITINELRVANSKRVDYHIFYIVVDIDKWTATGFIFGNPIEKFGVDFDDLARQISIFEPTKFRGNLQKHIHLVEKLELTEFLTKVLDRKPEYIEKLFTKADERLKISQTA